MEKVMYALFRSMEDCHWWFSGRKKIIAAMMRHFFLGISDFSLLDIGTGTGFMLSVLNRYGHVTALDGDGDAIAYARQRQVERVTYVHTAFPPYTTPEKSFDVVTLFDVLEHIEDENGALYNIYSLLKPGGYVMCTVPAFSFLWTAHDVINQHKRRYTRKELIGKLEKHGFSLLKCSYFNTFLFPLACLYKGYWRVRWQSRSKTHIENIPHDAINTILYFIFSCEQYLLPYLNFPFGVSLIGIARRPNNSDKDV